MYITYVVESQVILRSQVTDILSEKILLRCSVLRTGHSCRSYHSETYKDCNCKPFVHVHNGRYCAGLRLPIHRMHTCTDMGQPHSHTMCLQFYTMLYIVLSPQMNPFPVSSSTDLSFGIQMFEYDTVHTV